MAVEVTTPEDYMGDVIGDLNSRRGQIQAMEERSGARVVKAHVPLSEMFGYVGDLRSKTQGRANYSMVFDSYAEVPANVSKEIIAKATGQRAKTTASSGAYEQGASISSSQLGVILPGHWNALDAAQLKTPTLL